VPPILGNDKYVCKFTVRKEIVDEKQQRQVNEAAEKFAEALKESYQSIADRSVSAQELNAQVTQDFFNGVINNLRTQAENNRALSEDLIEQQRRQQEASQALAQESLGAYMDFLNSMFSYYRGNLDEAQRRANQ
jgi:ABC-type nitrate/sulfonate/bicarbonate transport system substrate-binding protein